MVGNRGSGGNRSGSGRPSKNDTPPSRSKFLCPVCGSEKRNDKLQDHLQQLCHFDDEGKPLDSSDDRYKTLSKESKQHTDYCVQKGIKKDELVKSWKRLSPAEQNLNPFEQMRKRPPSQALRQAMTFSTSSEAAPLPSGSNDNNPQLANLEPAEPANPPLPTASTEPSPTSTVPPDPPDEPCASTAVSPSIMEGEECVATRSGKYWCHG